MRTNPNWRESLQVGSIVIAEVDGQNQTCVVDSLNPDEGTATIHCQNDEDNTFEINISELK